MVALAALVLAAGCGGVDRAGPPAGATVERVVDGDTIVLADGRRVRLVQIDAPEVAERECYSRGSTAALRRLLPDGVRVELQADPALDDVDRYGRLLRYVRRGGTNVNLTLVRNGAAAPYFFDGDRGRYAGEFLDAAREARHAERGLWRACLRTQLDPDRSVETLR